MADDDPLGPRQTKVSSKRDKRLRRSLKALSKHASNPYPHPSNLGRTLPLSPILSREEQVALSLSRSGSPDLSPEPQLPSFSTPESLPVWPPSIPTSPSSTVESSRSSSVETTPTVTPRQMSFPVPLWPDESASSSSKDKGRMQDPLDDAYQQRINQLEERMNYLEHERNLALERAREAEQEAAALRYKRDPPPGSPEPSNHGGSNRGGRRNGRQKIFGSGPPTKIKMNLPEKFDGESKHLDKFIREIKSYISINSASFAENDRVSIIWVLSLMSGPKIDPWVNRFDKAFKNEDDTHEDYCDTLYDFLLMLHRRFGDKNKKTTAQTKLAEIKQGSKSVEEYITDFKTIAVDTDFNDEALLVYFVKGLNHRVAMLAKQYPVVTTYDAWVDLVRRIEKDQVFYSGLFNITGHGQQTQQPSTPVRPQQPVQPSRNFQGQYLPRSQVPRPSFQQRPPPPPVNRTVPVPRPPAPRPVQQDPDAMQVDRTRTQLRCFRCKQVGHMAKDCSVRTINELDQQAVCEIVESHFSSPWDSAEVDSGDRTESPAPRSIPFLADTGIANPWAEQVEQEERDDTSVPDF